MSIKYLGKYEIIDRLGRGGMAEVYRGYQASLERYVAIKLLHPFLADDPEFKDRFEREARNVARLRHPNIVQVYDFEYDNTNESYYMVMELIDGQTLKDYLTNLHDKGERLSMREIIRIVRDALSALSYAHARGMIHRDVKPANLMIDSDGRVVLTDFGIAKIVTGVQFTASGGLVGTPAYMAPEQGLGEQGDERSDLYSVGVILFQMASGELPFDAEAPLAVILKHLNQPIPPIQKINPEVPDGMVAVVNKAMAKDPDERYQTADELIQALDEIELDPTKNRPAVDASGATVGDSGQNPRAEAPPPTPSDPKTVVMPPRERPNRSAAGIGGLIVIGLLAIVGLVLGGNQLLGALNPSATPTASPTPTVAASPTASNTASFTPTNTPSLTPSATSTFTLTPSYTATVTNTPTFTPTNTPTVTPSPTITPSYTATPTNTYTPSATPSPTVNFTATFQQVTLVAQNNTATAVYATVNALVLTQNAGKSPTPDYTATALTCKPQYVVVTSKATQVPIPADSDFKSTITLRNTGDCDWLPGIYLQYHDTPNGERFSASIKIIANEQAPIKPSDVATFTFIGHTPKRGGTYTGSWEVRLSPDNRLLDPLLLISFFTYE